MKKYKIIFVFCLLFICLITTKVQAQEQYQIYGTTGITSKAGDTVDLTDSTSGLYRLFAKSKVGSDLITEVSNVNSTGSTSSNNKATFIYGNGTKKTVYDTGTITYNIKNTSGTKIGQESVTIKVSSTDRKIERTLYTLEDSSNTTNIGQNKAYTIDKQDLGIYLPSGAKLNVKQINSNYKKELSVYFYNDDVNKEGSQRDSFIIRSFLDGVSLGRITTPLKKVSNNVTQLENQSEIELYTVDKINSILTEDGKETITEEKLKNIINEKYPKFEYNSTNRILSGSYECVPFIETPKGTEKPIIEVDLADQYFDLNATQDKKARRLLFYQYKDDEDKFKENWKKSNDEFAIISNARVNLLVPRCDINILTLEKSLSGCSDTQAIRIVKNKKTKELEMGIEQQDGTFIVNNVIISLNPGVFWNSHYTDGTLIIKYIDDNGNFTDQGTSKIRYYTLTYNQNGNKIEGRADDYVEKDGKYYYLLRDENNNLYNSKGEKLGEYSSFIQYKKYEFHNSLDELLEFYKDLLEKYDSWAGLDTNDTDGTNKNVISRYIIKANVNGGGSAYAGFNEIGMSSVSLADFNVKSWTVLHELGHTYEGPYRYGKVDLVEVINNLFAHYYMTNYINIDKNGELLNYDWLYNGNSELYDITNKKRQVLFESILNKIRKNMQKDNKPLEAIYDAGDGKKNTYEYPDELLTGIDDIKGLDSYHLRLYLFVNLFDKIGVKESLSSIYSNVRKEASINDEYKAEEKWQANSMAKSLSDYYNVIPYFDAWGFFTDDYVKNEIYEKDKEILYFLAEIVGEDKAENIRQYLSNNLTTNQKKSMMSYEGIYSLVSNTDLTNYYKANNLTVPKGKIEINVTAKKPKIIRLKSGNNVIKTYNISGSSKISDEVEIGAYEIEFSEDGQKYYNSNQYIISSIAVEKNTVSIELESAVSLNDLSAKTVTERDNVTFNVTINSDGDPSEYTYQWYVNTKESTTGGTEIVGAQSASYTVKATNDLNGKYFYCVVKNGIFETATNASKLTVTPIKYTLTINGKSSSTVAVSNKENVTIKITCSPELKESVTYRAKIYKSDGTIDNTEEKDSNTNEIVLSPLDLWGDMEIEGYVLDSDNKKIGTTNKISVKLNTPVTLGKIGNQTVEEGQNVTFKVVKEKDGKPAEYTYQWYKNSANNTIGGTKIAGARSASYTVKATSDLNGKYFYCVVTNGACTTKTNAAKLTVKVVEYTLTINGKSDDTVDVMHGQDVTAKIVCSNSSANVSKYRFEVHYEDEEDTQVFSSEENEKVIKSGYFFGGTTSVIGYALDSTNKVIGTTKSIKINLNTAVTLGKIGDQTVEEGKNVTFKVVKEKDGEPAEYTYQWYKNNRNSTTGGTKITGAESASYTVKATSDLNGKYFYCVVKNGICTTTTNAAKLTVKVAEYTLTINGKSDDTVDVMHGQDVTAKILCSNSSANVSKYRFEVHYEAEEDTQVFSSEGNEKVIKSGYFYGGTTSVIGYALDSTNKVIGTTKSIKINLNTAVTLGKIGDQTVEEGKNVTFKVVKEKDGEPAEYTYQWYKNNRNSTTGGTKITGARSASYTVKATSDLNGKYFYCVVKNGICTTTTNAAKLTVKIDTEGPTITRAVLSNNNWTKSNKTITVTATDNQTGVKGYGISNSKSKAPETWSESNIIEVTQNGTYYVWAKDGKGNTSCFGTAIQSKIDKNKPKIGQITVSNYVITVSGITDSESGIAKISISSTSGKYDWKSNTNNTYTTGKLTPGTYYIAVMDNAGNIVEQSKVVNKENILVKNIKLSQKDLTLNNAVKSTKLIATIDPEDATEKGLKWKSSNEKVAKVDQNGVVTAVANGTAQITVEATDASGVSTTITCKVIEHTNPTGIEIQGKNRVRKDEKYTYIVKYTPEDANINKDVKWTVNDEEIATINGETGEVEGKKAGKVTITASLKKIENVVATKEIEVYYENPTTAEPSATVTTNSIEVENRQTNEYAEIVKIEYGISENGEDWRWQESNKFEELTEDKEYKIKTRATDENGATSESEILEVKTNKLELGKLLLKKNGSDGYEEGTWTNSNISYELVDEKNLTAVKILNENNEVVDIENNEIRDSGVYTILVETTDGTNKKSKEYKVKIDKGTAELIINKDSEEEVELVKLKVKLEGSISGIKSLKINGVNIEYNNEEIIYEVTENGTYKFEVEDNAGNIIERSIEVSNIKKKDTEVPKDDDNKTDTKPSDNVEIKDNQSGLEQTEDKDTSDRILPQTGEKIIICIAISIGIIVYAIRTYIKIKRIY